MEDHRGAYFLWRELGLRGQTCLHVDAHLDVSDLKTPSCDHSFYPEINCGNFLTPALREGIIDALIWVLPGHLTQCECLLNWTRQELQNWLHLELEDYLSLKMEGGRVEGNLLGAPFTVCTSDHLPEIEGPLVLDIDVDYYLDPQDNLWQTPLQLADHLRHLNPEALTVAYSVEGGYTPVRHRPMGPLTVLALAQPDQAQKIWQSLEEQSPLDKGAPAWLQAAAAARAGDFARAAQWDPGYRKDPADLASAAQMREQYALAKAHLKRVKDLQEKSFLSALVAFKEGAFLSAAELWSELLSSQDLDRHSRLFLFTFCGRAYSAAGLAEQAFRCFQEGLRLDRDDSELSYLAARTCVQLSRLSEAARLYRRAIKLAPMRLKTAEITLELAEVYLSMGQAGFAERLLKSLLRSRVPGFIKFKAEGLALKTALGKSL